MPRPGSHAYDELRKRLRKRFERQGLNDQQANRRADQKLQRDEANRPRKVGERAEGPKGER